MEKTSKIYIAGHDGLVGSALVRKFNNNGYANLLTRHYTELDLRQQADVTAFFEKKNRNLWCWPRPKWAAFLANNTYPAEFIYDNLAIEINIIHASLANRCPPADISGFILYLSQRMPPAHERIPSPYRTAGSHQRTLCHRQDRGH